MGAMLFASYATTNMGRRHYGSRRQSNCPKGHRIYLKEQPLKAPNYDPFVGGAGAGGRCRDDRADPRCQAGAAAGVGERSRLMTTLPVFCPAST